MPKTILNGKVKPNVVDIQQLDRASGTVILIAAGTAKYDALAHKTTNKSAFPGPRDKNLATKTPIKALNNGIKIANPNKNEPAFFNLGNL